MALHENYGSTAATLKSWLPNGNQEGGESENSQQHYYQSVPSNTGINDPPKELDDNFMATNRLGKVWKVSLIAAALGFLAYQFYHYGFEATSSGDDFSYQYITEDQHQKYYDDIAGRAPISRPIGERSAFSTAHPIELGVPYFDRPNSSRPSIVLTHNEENKDGPTHFPTNAWYQNMLLVPTVEQTTTKCTNTTTDTTSSPSCVNITTTTAEPTKVHRAYTTPFLVDAAGPVPGLRIIPNNVLASTSIIQINANEEHGLTVGAAPLASATNNTKQKTFSHEYRVEHMTPLGLTLGWGDTYPMNSSIVKGMPYGTMVYEKTKHEANSEEDDQEITETWYPTVASAIPLGREPLVDGKYKLACLGGPLAATKAPVSTVAPSNTALSYASTNTSYDTLDSSSEEETYHVIKVEREIELYFAESDFTWLVFVSRPVMMQCVIDPITQATKLQVVEDDGVSAGGTDVFTTEEDEKEFPPFVIRIALARYCTSNKNPIYCHYEQMIPFSLGIGQGRYDDLLRNHSRLVPGPNTNFDYSVDERREQIDIVFDWDARDMYNFNKPLSDSKEDTATSTLDNGLIAFALPHHLDLMGTRFAPGYLKYCARTLIGPACVLAGSQWKMAETIPPIGFRAPRPPAPWAVKSLAKSTKKDLGFKLPKLYQKGSGDTYFSGKMLAKLGRVLVIAEELLEICGQTYSGEKMTVENRYTEACHGARLPSLANMRNAVGVLRSSVEIWLNGKGVTPFVYDNAWGGVVNCGCNNPDGGDCENKFPECPAFLDPGLNFGNAFYNDIHFHYGYHIFAAAVVSHFDPEWGQKYFERVLLLVRNIANPSDTGDYFPAFRMKDWYQGHSWASGVVPPFLNGRNQESSSESLAAYEAVAIYGNVMKSAFSFDEKNRKVAEEVEKAGQILTATELRSTRRYYHVRSHDNANEALKIYPKEYTNHAIGMMWNTMAQYQTWFGGKPYLAAGIQLLPITPIAEQRDGTVWVGEMYPSFASSCEANEDCKSNGWSVLQFALLATMGYQENATQGALSLNPKVFESAGGNGHSLTNTLWYIATRQVLAEPIQIGDATKSEDATGPATPSSNTTTQKEHIHEIVDCYVPEICTDYVLDTIADEYSCRQRMTDLIATKGHTQEEACFMIAQIQFPKQCGACVPNATDSTKKYYKPQCPPCTVDQCQSNDLNRCPRFSQTFVCTDGTNRGGCSRFPWDVRSAHCNACCELTECLQ